MSALSTLQFKRRTIAMGVLACLSATALALPADGVVTNGNAVIATGGTGSLTITQTSNAATINWQSFSIGANEIVRFLQPSSSSVTLNRVLGSDPSSILGNLSANGQVFLVNPNGILFGRGASVNVGGLAASTLGLGDSDFLAGRYRFQGSSASGITNLGTIQAQAGGFVALVGNSVTNEGSISAPLGSVALTGGSAVTLDFAGDGLMKVEVTQAALNAAVRNSGTIQAEGGAVWMTASARDAMLSTVIDNTGIVQANSVGFRNGRIYLDGGESGVVNVGGTLQVAGTTAGTTGGTIAVSGDKVAVNDGAVLDATGVAGGGTIAVGGGWQGKDPGIRQANAVYIAQGASLDASATGSGDGGTIVAWSNVSNAQSSTRVYGSLRARGGDLSGNGGRIETSGHWLDVTGMQLDAAAPRGIAGIWLLDPEDLTVTAAATTAAEAPAGIFTSGAGTTNVQAALIVSRLNAGTSVLLQTAPTGTGNGDISVNASVAATPAAPVALTMTAQGSITLAPGITISATANPMDVNLLAGGAISLGSGSSISSNGGNIVLTGSSLTNNAGASVFNTGAGRWLVYTSSPLNDTLGGLNSGNPAIFGQDPGSLPPPSVAAGNWFIYASANPTTAVTQTLGSMQSTLGATPPAPNGPAPAPLLLAFEPPDWLFQSLEDTGLALLQAIGSQGTTSTIGFTSAAPSGSTLAGVAPGGASSALGATPLAGNPVPPPTSRLRSTGLSGLPKPANTTVAKAPTQPSIEAFLRGAAQSLQVGTSSSGAVLLATLSSNAKAPGMAVTVSPGEGFRIAIPPQLLQALQPNGRATPLQAQVSGGPLPDWLSFDRATPVLAARAVPNNALPLTVRLISANGKFADVVFQ